MIALLLFFYMQNIIGDDFDFLCCFMISIVNDGKSFRSTMGILCLIPLIKLIGNYYPFTLSLNLPLHLKVTTRLGARIISSPVAGFLPLRSRLSLTQNLPNPLIRTSSPDARVDLINSRIVSTVSVDCFLVNPFWCAMASVIWDLVRVTMGGS